MANAEFTTRRTTYEIITDRIIEQLEQGCVPWHKPWSAAGGAGLPRNLRTLKPYRGINVWVLMSAGYSSPYFLTFNQAKELGGNVKKGEHGLPVCFWQFGIREVEEGEEIVERSSVLCRYYTVFSVEQCENLKVSPVAPPEPEVTGIPACDAVIANWLGKPDIRHRGNRACYWKTTDAIEMPQRSSFNSQPEYYSTLFHELSHSTGHPQRLNRSTLTDAEMFGDENYSREELVAEMGAAFLCGMTGIENKTISNSTAYLQSWLKALKADNRMVLVAAGQAQKAADLILGNTTVKGEETLPVPLAVHQPKEYAIDARSIAIASKVKCPIAALPVPGKRPILIRRKVLKIATANMHIASIGITKDEDGRRFLNIAGTDKKNPHIHRRYAFKDQDVLTCKKLIAHWVRSQRTHSKASSTQVVPAGNVQGVAA